MSKIAVEKIASDTSVAIASYDKAKWSLGSLIRQMSGVSPEQNYIGPNPVALARPIEESTAIPLLYPHAVTFSSTIDWVFAPENSAAASATRRIVAYEYNKLTSQYNYKGFITMTLQTATAHTIRGFRMGRYTHSTGTVAVSGTAVTGTSTLFSSDSIGVGARIGFGSTDPTQITTWYVISAIGSDTGITLATSAPTLGSGTSYVIEELRPMLATSNATLANGGLFVAKGVNFNDFSPAGTTIAASASTVNNLKLVYWLADAATVTNTVAASLMLDTQASATQHDAYILNGTTSVIVYKYNLRALDTITAGKMTLTGSNIVITGTQAVTGTLSQANNGRVATTSHGAGSGVKSMYFVTTTRVYRAALSNITNGNVNWQSDNRTEVPPGSATTFAATSLLASIEYIDSIDRFIIPTTNAAAARSYITRYPTTSGDPFDYTWGVDMKQLDQSSVSNDSTPVAVNTLSLGFSCWSENGITHMIRYGGTLATNHHMYAVPFGAHWDFAATTLQRAITPEFLTPNCSTFIRMYVQELETVGLNALDVAPEPFRVYYRTAGISDNSGSWTLLNQRGDLSGVASATSIQFMFEFQTIGIGLCIPARIFSVAVVYEDLSTLSNYQPSATLSSASSKRFAWRFSTAFGSTVPALRVRLYNAETGGLLVDDNTASPTGTFERSTDTGGTWAAWTSADKANENTYIRYTPSSLADNIKVRALLTLN